MPELLDDPRLAPVLPLLYVAWADGVLSPQELDAIREKVDRHFPWLPGDLREEIKRWLRPGDPPGPEDLALLRERVRALASPDSNPSTESLSALALDLAARGKQGSEAWAGTDARAALEDLEDALGVVGSEAARTLVGGEIARGQPPPRRLFDPAILERFLAEPQAPLRREVLAHMASAPVRIRPRPSDMETYRERVLRAVTFLAEQGYGMLALPRSVGGQEDPAAAIAVFETLALGDLSVLVKFGVQFGLFGGSVLQLGTTKHHDRYLAAIGSLALPGCFAMTEVDHGSNVRGIRTYATFEPESDTFRVETPDAGARKDWIGGAARDARMASVFAQLRVRGYDHGVHVLLVPIRDEDGAPLPGVTIEDRGQKVGLRGVDNGRLGFSAVRVPRDNLLDRYASVSDRGEYDSPIASDGRRFFTMLGALVAGRISIAAASLSVAKTALIIAVRHGDRRVQFGPAGEPEIPILEYLVHQRALLPRLATTYGLHFAVRALVSRYAEGVGGDARRVEALAAGLKAVASRHAVDTVQAAREACGGEGYAAENRFGELRADADIFTTFEGANPVLLQLVARALLAQYGEEMGDLKIWDLIRHLAERSQTRISTMNPVVVRNTDEEHLRDPELHAAALAYREERLLGSVARRLKARIDEGMDSFHAMNDCQDHLVAVARAHVDRVVLDRFLEGVARSPTPGLSEALGDLARLYALSRLEAHRAWYLEAGYFEPAKSRAIRLQVNRLCREVRESAVLLVGGFGIPDDVLDAPAGRA